MVEEIALQGRCWYQAKIKVTCSIFFFFFFKETIKNTEKDEVVKFMVYKLTYKAIKALLNKRKLCS